MAHPGFNSGEAFNTKFPFFSFRGWLFQAAAKLVSYLTNSEFIFREDGMPASTRKYSKWLTIFTRLKYSSTACKSREDAYHNREAFENISFKTQTSKSRWTEFMVHTGSREVVLCINTEGLKTQLMIDPGSTEFMSSKSSILAKVEDLVSRLS